jgi:hypothetical protein
VKLLGDTHGNVQLRIRDDKSDIELEMNYDDQLEQFQTALRDGEGTVTPKPPLKRYEGEGDEVYFDRCCVTAHRQFLEAVEERILVQSRFERLEFVKSKISEEVSNIEQTLLHWDNDEPTERDISAAQALQRQLDELQNQLSDIG